MEHLKLITEKIEDVQYVTEDAADGKKDLYLKGIFMQAGVANRNRRIYPVEVMREEVNRYIKEKVEKNQAFGELNHPPTPSINLDRVSHLIKELHWDGNNVVGKAKIISTPMGNIARNLISEGASLGVSSRALGALKPLKDGINEVTSLKLATAADIVSDPSAPDAWVQGIYEGAEWVMNPSGYWAPAQTQKIEEIRDEIREAPKAKLDEGLLLKSFDRYLKSFK